MRTSRRSSRRRCQGPRRRSAWLYKEPRRSRRCPIYEDIPFYGKQQRITLRNCGVIDPESIDEYIARGGYEALGKALPR